MQHNATRTQIFAGRDTGSFYVRVNFSMYVVIVVSFAIVLPVVSVLTDHFSTGTAIPLLLAKWLVFWAVGGRLFSAGIRQVSNPRYTAEVILGLKTKEPWIVVRELGFANIAIGTIGLASLAFNAWRAPAAVAGCLYYGCAGVQHVFSKHRTRLETVAMISDLYLCAALACAVAASF
jgi:hypothetical protein